MDKIDYKFLSDREGGSQTVGYVPAAAHSKSGVTIATGFDLGQRDEADLRNLGLDATLIAKLRPYMGKKKADAQKLLQKFPLTISKEQAATIDKLVKSSHVASLRLAYNGALGTGKKLLQALAWPAQTVIASVSFQYGVGLSVRTPKLWKAVTEQNWKSAVAILRNFGDVYTTRRHLEADLLATVLP